MFAQHAAKAYAQVGLETGVAAASPQHLIVMLYDGALKALSDAERHLNAGHLGPKGEAISKAISIIEDGLMASLDVKRGGQIAEHLLELYRYMNRRLLIGSVRNDVAMLSEVAGLLRELREAWATLDQPPADTAARVTSHRTA